MVIRNADKSLKPLEMLAKAGVGFRVDDSEHLLVAETTIIPISLVHGWDKAYILGPEKRQNTFHVLPIRWENSRKQYLPNEHSGSIAAGT